MKRERAALIANLGSPAARGLRRVGLDRLIVGEPSLIGLGRVAAAEGRHREIDEDGVGEQHHPEKANEPRQHVPPVHAIGEPGSRRHRSGPWNNAWWSALDTPSRPVTTKENSLAVPSSAPTEALSSAT